MAWLWKIMENGAALVHVPQALDRHETSHSWQATQTLSPKKSFSTRESQSRKFEIVWVDQIPRFLFFDLFWGFQAQKSRWTKWTKAHFDPMHLASQVQHTRRYVHGEFWEPMIWTLRSPWRNDQKNWWKATLKPLGIHAATWQKLNNLLVPKCSK